MKRWLALGALLAACGGPSSTAPASTAGEPSGARPVRIDTPDTASEPARPVRVAPTVPGEVAESDDLADPPPIEAPTP